MEKCRSCGYELTGHEKRCPLCYNMIVRVAKVVKRNDGRVDTNRKDH